MNLKEMFHGALNPRTRMGFAMRAIGYLASAGFMLAGIPFYTDAAIAIPEIFRATGSLLPFAGLALAAATTVAAGHAARTHAMQRYSKHDTSV